METHLAEGVVLPQMASQYVAAEGRPVGADADGQPVILRTPVVNVHYSLEMANPQDIQRIELWYAVGDKGPWQLFDVDPDRISPVRFIAPGEGIYRLLVVLVDSWGRKIWQDSAMGYAQAPMIPPDAQAHLTVFVDYSKPKLFLRSPKNDLPDWDQDAVMISWAGFDNALAQRPVQLYYQLLGSQQWTLIAPDQSATGQYAWQIPAELEGPVQVHVMLWDQAGNHSVESSGLITLARSTTNVPVHDKVESDKADEPLEAPHETTSAASEAKQPSNGLQQIVAEPYTPSVSIEPALAQKVVPAAEAMVANQGIDEYPQIDHADADRTDSPIIPAVAQNIQQNSGNLDLAMVHNTAVSLEEAKLRECFRRGNLHRRRHEWSQATQAFQEALALDPTCVEARMNLANTYYSMGRFTEAKEQLEHCIAQNPRLTKALWNLAQCQMALCQYAQAQEVLESLLRIDPEDWQAWLVLGDAAEQLGRHTVAISSWQHVVENAQGHKELVELARYHLHRCNP